MKRHYQIYKKVVCDLFGMQCGEDLPYTSNIIPNCTECNLYIEYQTSRIQKIGKHNELIKSDSAKTVPIVGQNPYPDMQVLPDMLAAKHKIPNGCPGRMGRYF